VEIKEIFPLESGGLKPLFLVIFRLEYQSMGGLVFDRVFGLSVFLITTNDTNLFLAIRPS
jgi:hypothetical protein